MQLSIAKRRGLTLLAATTLILFGAAGVVETRSDIATLLSGLYQRYAWVAVFSVNSPAGKVPLARATREELSGIFVSDLALAIWNDAQCAEKRGEICVLDFDVLFDSQDPSARDLAIEPSKQSAEARVCFKDVTDMQRCLTFIGAATDGIIKIADIRYTGGRSLRQMLRLPAIRSAR